MFTIEICWQKYLSGISDLSYYNIQVNTFKSLWKTKTLKTVKTNIISALLLYFYFMAFTPE